jgi:hypothetical protein
VHLSRFHQNCQLFLPLETDGVIPCPRATRGIAAARPQGGVLFLFRRVQFGPRCRLITISSATATGASRVQLNRIDVEGDDDAIDSGRRGDSTSAVRDQRPRRPGRERPPGTAPGPRSADRRGSLTPCFGYRHHHHSPSRTAHHAARSVHRARGIIQPRNHLRRRRSGDQRAGRTVVAAAVDHHG